MSISAISSSSLLDGSILSSLIKPKSTAATSSSVPDATPNSPSSSIGADLATLLRDLTVGNTSTSKTDLSRLKADLKAQHAALASQRTGEAPTPANPLDNLLSSLSDSLGAGNTSAALSQLTTYLVNSGQSTGLLVNTSA